jgi:hypothetical protein
LCYDGEPAQLISIGVRIRQFYLANISLYEIITLLHADNPPAFATVAALQAKSNHSNLINLILFCASR